MQRRLIVAVIAGAVLIAAPALLRDAAPKPVHFRNPLTSPHQVLEGIYRADRRTLTGSMLPVRGVIVPHHLVAAESIALGIRALAEHPPQRIILLSPDHFHKCPTLLCTVFGEFETQEGVVLTDADDYRALTASDLVTDAPELFRAEHGVFSVTPFIAKYLPNIPVTPVVLSQRLLWKGRQTELRELFESLIDDRAAFIVSSDFSHYLPLEESDRMDEITLAEIEAGDLEAMQNFHNADQSDCPGCLWVLASLMKDRSLKPEVLMHTNAARILGDPTVQETTSHFSIIYR